MTTREIMPSRELAIDLLQDRYSETFAVTAGARPHQTHLFLIKFEAWALVYTFTLHDFGKKPGEEDGIPDALVAIKKALTGGDPPLQAKFDSAVERAKERIEKKKRLNECQVFPPITAAVLHARLRPETRA